MHEMLHLLPPDYEAVLVKLIAKLPRLEFSKEMLQSSDMSSDITFTDPARVHVASDITFTDPARVHVDPIAAFNTRNTGHYNMT